MANFGPSKTWTDGEILSHTDLNAALLDIINNVTNNNIDADNIDETDDYTWSGANSFVGGHSIKVLSNAASSIVTGTTLEWDPGDGGQMTDNSSGISLDFKLPDAADNQDVFASIAAICLDDAAGSEDGELSFRVATAGTNTEKMTLSSTALTVTPAITASGGITGSVTSSNVSITGGSITGITDIAIADGGTGASTAAAARTNLGLEIGVDVQAYDAELQALSGLTPTDSNIIVGNGSTFVTESGATARTSLGLGSIATQDASAVSITGGSLTGMTSYSGGSFSGTTGTFSGAVNANNLVLDASGNYPILLENQAGTTADAAISTFDDANGTLLALGSNFYFSSGGSETRFNTSEEAAGIVLNRTGTISLRTSDGSNNTVERVSVGNTGDFAVNTSQLFVDQSTARVGINTNSPKDTLHVKLGTNLNWQFGYPNNSVTTLAALNDAESAYVTARIDAGTLELNGQSGGDVNICAGGLFVDASADRVGINTASPQVDFHVNNASTNGVARISTSNAGSYAQLQLVNQSGNYWYQTIVSDNSYRLYNGSDRLTLTSAGLLGLGTTSPQAMLDTTGVFRSTGGTGVPSTGTGAEFFIDSGVAYFQGYNRTGSAFIETRLRGNPIVLDGGSVGIGTSSPGETLTVVGGGSTTSTANFTGGAANTNATLASDYSMVFQIDANNTVGGRNYNWRVGGKGFSDGSALMTLTSAGLLGIGTDSPGEKLTISGPFRSASQDWQMQIVNSDSFAADKGGGIAFGGSYTGSTQTYFSNILGAKENGTDGNVAGYLAFYTRGSGQPYTTERARIDSSGRFLLNTTSPFASSNAVLHINADGVAASAGSIMSECAATSLVYHVHFRNGNGAVGGINTNGTATNYVTSSDYRLKENVVGITDGITRIKSLKPSRFNFIAEADRTVDGFVAHEVSDIVPEAISGAKDAVDDEGNPQYQGIDQSKLVPLLTAALQEAITKIETLETKVAALEAA